MHFCTLKNLIRPDSLKRKGGGNLEKIKDVMNFNCTSLINIEK